MKPPVTALMPFALAVEALKRAFSHAVGRPVTNSSQRTAQNIGLCIKSLMCADARKACHLVNTDAAWPSFVVVYVCSRL